MNKLIAVFAVATIAGPFCAGANAGIQSDVPTEAVRYANLQAANNADVAVLYRRIDAAAGKVCGQRLAPGSLAVAPGWRHCVQSAVRHAVADINAPAVTAYAAAQGVMAHDSSVVRN